MYPVTGFASFIMCEKCACVGYICPPPGAWRVVYACVCHRACVMYHRTMAPPLALENLNGLFAYGGLNPTKCLMDMAVAYSLDEATTAYARVCLDHIPADASQKALVRLCAGPILRQMAAAHHGDEKTFALLLWARGYLCGSNIRYIMRDPMFGCNLRAHWGRVGRMLPLQVMAAARIPWVDVWGDKALPLVDAGMRMAALDYWVDEFFE